jgi:hypothetical protein
MEKRRQEEHFITDIEVEGTWKREGKRSTSSQT